MVANQQNVALPGASTVDRASQFACIIVCDVSGFVKVANAHSTLFGPKAGAEKTRLWLDRIFDLVVSKILAHGGEVVQFVGDAVIARFAANHVSNAIDCSHEIVLICQTLNTGVSNVPRTGVRVGVGRGDSELTTLTCVTGRELSAVLGLATERALKALQLATSRFLVVCHASVAQGTPNSHILKTFLTADRTYFGLESPTPLVQSLDSLNQFVAVQVASGSNEIKLLTILYVEFIPLQHAVSWNHFLADFNVLLPSFLAEYHATLTGCCQTEKGFRVQLVLGQINSQESDVERAIQLASKIQEMPGLGLQSIVTRASVGYGHLWQGNYQRENLQWFHAHGREVNLAARVLELTPTGQIYLTEGASSRVSGNTQLVELASVPVKGESRAVRAFRIPFAHEAYVVKSAAVHTSHGRPHQVDQLAWWLGQASSLNHPMLVEVTGQAGVGKSSLLKGFQNSLVGGGYTIIELKANPQSRLFPYAVAYQLLLEIFAVQKIAGTVESWVTETLTGNPYLSKWIGLLNLITPLKLDQFESPLYLSATVKAEATASVYRALLKGLAKKAKLLFLIEDVQWFDDLSQQLIVDTVFEMPNCKCIYTARTLSEAKGRLVYFPKIPIQTEHFHRIELKPLSVPEVRLFLQHWFDVPQLPVPVVEAIAKLSEGNLLLLTALCQRLVQSGVICKSEAGRTLAIDYSRFEVFTTVPLHVEHAVQVRTDKLSALHRQVLRQCSIFRSAFTIDELQQVFSYPSKAELDEAFIELQRHRLIKPWLVTPEGTTFRFEHQVIEQCIYERIPDEERVILHAQCAAWLLERIRIQPDSIGHRLSIRLAAQYQWAGMLDKAIPLSKRVAEYSYQIGALDDALERIDSIIQWFSSETKAEQTNLELAHWLERKAQIHFAQGQLKDAEANYIKVLKCSGAWIRVPEVSELRLRRGFRRLAFRRWLPRWLVIKRRKANSVEVLVFKAYTSLSEISFHFGRFAESYLYLIRAMQIASPVKISTGDLPKAFASCALAANALGEVDCAAYFAQQAHRGLTEVEGELEIARARAFAYHRLGYMAYAAANFDLSYQISLDSVEAARQSCEFQIEALAFSMLPMIRVAQGRYTEALQLIDEYDLLVKMFTTSYYNVFHQYALINHRVYCLAMLGRLQEARELLGNLETIQSEFNFPELPRLAIARCKLAVTYCEKDWVNARIQALAIAALPAEEAVSKAFLVSCISLPLQVLLDSHVQHAPLGIEECKAVDVLLSKLARASSIHDLALPVYLILNARVLLLKGSPGKQVKTFLDQALRIAQHTGQEVEAMHARQLLQELHL